jgi:hypothetical protein
MESSPLERDKIEGGGYKITGYRLGKPGSKYDISQFRDAERGNDLSEA